MSLFVPQLVRNTRSFIVEDSVVDPEKQTMRTFTRNITLRSFMVVEERCVYEQSETEYAQKQWNVLPLIVWLGLCVILMLG